MVGTASARYIHFHPAMPNTPFSSIRPVDIGAPAATAIGSASVKPAMTRARCFSGNQ